MCTGYDFVKVFLSYGRSVTQDILDGSSIAKAERIGTNPQDRVFLMSFVNQNVTFVHVSHPPESAKLLSLSIHIPQIGESGDGMDRRILAKSFDIAQVVIDGFCNKEAEENCNGSTKNFCCKHDRTQLTKSMRSVCWTMMTVGLFYFPSLFGRVRKKPHAK